MSRYLLDTTIFIDFSKGREPVCSRIMGMIDAGDELGVCAINVAEFYSGLLPEVRYVWDEFFGALQYWDITREAAAQAGQYRYELARKGESLSVAHALVAAVAQKTGAIVVTSNVMDYPMSDVELLSF